MRRGLTPSWIGNDGSYYELARIQFKDQRIVEDYIQRALHTTPSLLPVSEVDSSFAPIISLGREIDGFDNLFISPMGRITLVETKLWRNPQATREVIAQILEYAVRMSSWSYDDLQEKARSALKPAPIADGSLYDAVRLAFPDDIPSEPEFIDEVSKSLTRGRFMLLVVGDGIRESLENMVGVLHQYPQMQFTFGLVELQLYEHPALPGGRLIVPQLLLNTQEVVRAVVKVQAEGIANVSVKIDEESNKSPQGYQRRRLTEDEFLDEIEDEADKNTIKRLLTFANEIGITLQWRSAGVSFRIDDPGGSGQKLTLFVINRQGMIYTGWLDKQLKKSGLDPQIDEDFINSICNLFPDMQPQDRDPSFLSRNLRSKEVAERFEEFTTIISETVEKIQNY